MARSICQLYAFKGGEIEPFTVLLKTDPTMGDVAGKHFDIFDENFPHVPSCAYFLPASLSLDSPTTSVQSSVSGSPSILSTTAASLTWVRI